jgi:hypothetical protein
VRARCCARSLCTNVRSKIQPRGVRTRARGYVAKPPARLPAAATERPAAESPDAPPALPRPSRVRGAPMLQNITCSSSSGTHARTRTCIPSTPVGIIVKNGNR